MKLRSLMSVWILIIIAVMFIGWLVLNSSQFLVTRTDDEQTTAWKSYGNADWGLKTVIYPESWRVSDTSLFDDTPAINVYKIESSIEEPPFTHHNNVTNVSIFPNGIPTEGLFAESKEVDFDPGFQFVPNRSIVFTLQDGTPFAAYLIPAERPDNWGESGFVWLRVRVSNLETSCVDESGVAASEENCSLPMREGYKVTWSGERDENEWNQALEILRSLEFNL